MSGYTHLLVLIENGAVPFCTYDNPRFGSAPAWMPLQLLQAITRVAKQKRIALSFLFGATRPPAAIERLTKPYAKIVPAALAGVYPDAVVVLDGGEPSCFAALPDNPERNVILQLGRSNLRSCAAFFESLIGKFRRLSIHVKGIEDFTPEDFTAYERALRTMGESLGSLYRQGSRIEVNLLSDRMMLTGMRNCDAGEKHLTLAPNGRLYLCPAFYHDSEDSHVGSFDARKGLEVKRIAGAALRCAPLCTRCDAYQCKRCIWLNRKTTLELNVPSEQQCAAAHLERDASRRLLAQLAGVEPFRRMPPIPELNYRDPLELIDLPPHALEANDPANDPML